MHDCALFPLSLPACLPLYMLSERAKQLSITKRIHFPRCKYYRKYTTTTTTTTTATIQQVKMGRKYHNGLHCLAMPLLSQMELDFSINLSTFTDSLMHSNIKLCYNREPTQGLHKSNAMIEVNQWIILILISFEINCSRVD